MKTLLKDRRTFIAFCALIALTTLGLHNNIDTSLAIAGVAAALASANSAESVFKSKKENQDVNKE